MMLGELIVDDLLHSTRRSNVCAVFSHCWHS